MEVELKPADRKLLESVIEKMSETHIVQKTELKHEHKDDESKHEHFNVDLAYLEQADACPDCKKGLEAFAKGYMKNLKEKRGDKPLVCVDCGLGVDESDEECPWCGGKEAKEK